MIAKHVSVACLAGFSCLTSEVRLDRLDMAAWCASSARKANKATRASSALVASLVPQASKALVASFTLQASRALVASFAPRVNAAHEALGYRVASQKACRV